MKKTFFLVSLLAIVIGYSCQNEFIGNDNSLDENTPTRSLNSELSVASAKEFFDAHIHMLNLPNFASAANNVKCAKEQCVDHHHEHVTDASAVQTSLPEIKRSNIMLEWDKSRSWSDDRASFVEIPMNVGGQLHALKLMKNGNTAMKNERTKVECMLLFQKNHGYDKPVCSIVTIIAHKSFLKKNKAQMKTLKHNVADSDFSGYVFYSDIKGSIKKAYMYEDGERTSTLHRVQKETLTPTSKVLSVSLFDIGVNASTYSLSWESCELCGGEHEWWECGDEEDDYCPYCGYSPCECCSTCRGIIGINCTCFCSRCGYQECTCDDGILCEQCNYFIESCICCAVCGPSYRPCRTCGKCEIHCPCCKTCWNNPCECDLCKYCYKAPCVCTN